MKYCKKCRRVIDTENDHCSCGNKLFEEIKYDCPCELISGNEASAAKAASLLTREGIPYSDVLTDKVHMMFGSVSGNHTIYVPFCFLKKSFDILVSDGITETPSYYDKLSYYDDIEWKELSPLKRNAVKILSVIAFACLVYLCIAGVDAVALFIKGLFE